MSFSNCVSGIIVLFLILIICGIIFSSKPPSAVMEFKDSNNLPIKEIKLLNASAYEIQGSVLHYWDKDSNHYYYSFPPNCTFKIVSKIEVEK